MAYRFIVETPKRCFEAHAESAERMLAIWHSARDTPGYRVLDVVDAAGIRVTRVQLELLVEDRQS